MAITINFNHSSLVSVQTTQSLYKTDYLQQVINTTLTHMLLKIEDGISLPYFSHFTVEDFKKPIEIDIYLTDPTEGRTLNNEARGKDYATNILSYPSDLPTEVLTVLPSIPLGELVICHEVVETQAKEQNKTVQNHLTHLLVHGTLHLLGFDHEQGADAQEEMESFEIAILKKLEINNPYE